MKPYNSDGNTNEDLNTVSPSARTFGISISNTFNQSTSSNAHSMTQRRLASNIPALQGDLQFSSHSYRSDISVPTPSSSNQVTSQHTSPQNNRAISMSYVMPVTPVDQLLHAPLQPPEIQRQVRAKTGSRGDGHSEVWLWPSADSSEDAIHTPLGPSNSHSLQALIDNSSPTLDHLSATAEAQQLFTPSPKIDYSSATNPILPRLPRRLSYSQPHTSTSPPFVFNSISSAIVQPSGNTSIDPFYNENLASPLDIKSFPLQPGTLFDNSFSSMGSPSSIGAHSPQDDF